MDKYLASIDEFTNYEDIENQLASISYGVNAVENKEDIDKLKALEIYLKGILVYLKEKKFLMNRDMVLNNCLEEIKNKIESILNFIKSIGKLEYLDVPRDMDIPKFNNWLSNLFYLYEGLLGREITINDFLDIIPLEYENSELCNRVISKYLEVFLKYNGKDVDRDRLCLQLIMSDSELNSLIMVDENGKSSISSENAIVSAVKIYNQRHRDLFKDKFIEINKAGMLLGFDNIDDKNIIEVKDKLEKRMTSLMQSVNILTSNLKRRDGLVSDNVYDIIFSKEEVDIRNKMKRDFLVMEISNMLTCGKYNEMSTSSKDNMFRVLKDAMLYLCCFDVFKQASSDYERYCERQDYYSVMEQKNKVMDEYEMLLSKLSKLEKEYVKNENREVSIIYSSSKKEMQRVNLEHEIDKIKKRMDQIIALMGGYNYFENKFIREFNCQAGFSSSSKDMNQELLVKYDYQQSIKNKNKHKFRFEIVKLNDSVEEYEEKLFGVFPIEMLPPTEDKINNLPLFREFGIKIPSYGSVEFRKLYDKIFELLNNSEYRDSIESSERIISSMNDDRLMKIHSGKFDTLISTVNVSKNIRVRK